jgi:nucleotide-binding universal stress UspA family protein
MTAAAGDELDALVGSRRQYLERLAESFEGLDTRTRVELGTAAAGIVTVVKATTNPVVAMASHGRSGVRRLVVGSVAARVLGEVDCPVLLVHEVPGQSAPAAAPSFERVLVPLDGSAFGEAVIERLPAVLGPAITLHLVRVIDTPGIDIVGTDEPELSLNYGLVAEYMDATRDEASQYLTRMTEDLTRRGFQVSSEIRDGEVAQEINRSAEAAGAALIAMTTHGRGGLSRLVMGSAAEKVLRGATRPLLLVRPS